MRVINGFTSRVTSVPGRLLLLWFAVSVMAASVAAEPLRVVAPHWPPYVDREAEGRGSAARLVTTALERAGYPVEFVIEPWPRALEGATIGVFDVVATVWPTEERTRDLLFSEPYLVNEIRFIKRRGEKIDYENLDDLKGWIIGVVRDFAYDPAFDAAKTLLKVPKNYAVQNLLELKQGSIDLTLGDERALRYDLEVFMPGSRNHFEFLPKPLSRRGLSIAVGKEHPKGAQIIADFEREIERMKADGSYRTILGQ